MNMDLQEELINQAWHSAFGLTLPPSQHFFSTERFWEILKEYADDGVMFIDCGAGSGHTCGQSGKYGIKMSGCDIFKRDQHDIDNFIQPMPAHRMPYSEILWALVCRPDHSGWVEHLFQHTRDKDCGFIYVGHEEKVLFDVGDSDWDRMHKNVGNDNEIMFIWLP